MTSNQVIFQVLRKILCRRSTILVLPLLVLSSLLASPRAALANDIYLAQSASGSGTSCSSPLPASFFNNSANWGTAFNQIGPGTKVHLCGAFTSSLSVQKSGASLNPITVLAEPGASIKIPNGTGGCPIILNNNSHLVFDGGGPGGTNGVLAVLNNGSGLATQLTVSAFCLSTSSGDIEIKNWMIGPIYQHTSLTDHTGSIDTSTNAFAANSLSGNLSFHDNVVHDVGTPVQILATISGSPTIDIYNNYFYNHNWALGFAPASGGPYVLKFHDNHVGSTKNWDTDTDLFHHNGIHFFTGNGPNSIFTGVYNNLFDGDWGTCCTTAFIYQEFSPIANSYYFNNIFKQATGNLMPLLQVSPQGGGIFNNTFTCGAGGSNNQAIRIWSDATNAPIQNNAFYNCNQFITLVGTVSSMGGAIDHNIYMVQGPGGVSAWGDKNGGTSTFSSWQSKCACDSHSTYTATNYLSTDGSPLSTFPGSPSGSYPGGNIANIAVGSVFSLLADTSAGNTRKATLRPLLPSPWTVGAFNLGGATTSQVAPPTSLSVSVN
jgi:hypothetical protein